MNIRLATLLVGIILSVLSLQTAASTTTIVKLGDAGQTLNTAQTVGTLNAGDILTGSIASESDADFFGITLADGFNWTVIVTSPGLSQEGISDSVLFLFDQSSKGKVLLTTPPLSTFFQPSTLPQFNRQPSTSAVASRPVLAILYFVSATSFKNIRSFP